MRRQRIRRKQAAKWMMLGMLVTSICLIHSASAFTGALTSSDFTMLGTGNWMANGPTNVHWSVYQNTDTSWHYSYTLSHPSGSTNHAIIETAPAFLTSDIISSSGSFGELEVGWHYQGTQNPSLPSSIYGILFDDANGFTSTFAFDTYRAPMWGDFYANGERDEVYGNNTTWNQGFGWTDSDPVAPPSNGSIDNHILVPSAGLLPVPEPSAILLLGVGLVGAHLLRRRRG